MSSVDGRGSCSYVTAVVVPSGGGMQHGNLDPAIVACHHTLAYVIAMAFNQG